MNLEKSTNIHVWSKASGKERLAFAIIAAQACGSLGKAEAAWHMVVLPPLEMLWVALEAGQHLLDWSTFVADLIDGCKQGELLQHPLLLEDAIHLC